MARTPKVVEDRREQIIDAAMHVFAQKGFSGATNKDIARQAGITPGLIYHYFDNKEALLQAIIENRSPVRLLREMPSQMLEMPAQNLLPFLASQVLSRIEDEPFIQLIRVFLPEAIHNPDFGPVVATLLQQVVAFLSSYLAVRMEQGELRQADPSLAAQVFIGCMMGFVLRRHVLHDSLALQYSREQIADTIATTTLQGLLPR